MKFGFFGFVSILALLTASCSARRGSGVAGTKAPQVPSAEERLDGAQELAEFERMRRSVDGEPIAYERYEKARTAARRLPVRRIPAADRATRELSIAAGGASPSLLTGWTNLGPANLSGMSRSLLIDPVNPMNMFTTGINGGIWKSTDGGANWRTVGDFLPVLVIGSLAMAPQDPNILYAGTGDGFAGYDAARGAGMFQSTDGGETWVRLDSTAADPNFWFVNKLAVSAVVPGRVYAATNAGILRSDDSGASWNVVLDRGLPNRGCHDLAIRTDQATDVVLASCGLPALRSNGALLNKVDPREDGTLPAAVFVNQDAGNDSGASAWNAVITDPALGLSSVAIAPSNQNIMYVSASTSQGTYTNALFAIFRSDDGGSTWRATVRNTDPKPLNTAILGYPTSALCQRPADFTGQAWHDNAIAVDPVDPNRVWVAGVDIFRSDDGGANWGIASYWWATPGTPQYSHADHHVLMFHPAYDGNANQTIFAVNDGGLFRSDNARADLSLSACNISGSVRWQPASSSIATYQFYHGSVTPDGKTYIGGAQDNGTVLGTDSGGPRAWIAIAGGDGGAVAIDPSNPNIMYATTTGGGILKSTNGGRSFQSATRGITELANFFAIGTFVMDPTNPQRLWTGGNAIWRTVDGAATWTAASAPMVPRSYGSFAVSPADGNRVLAGSRTGEIFLTTNALSTGPTSQWQMAKPRTGWVSALVFDPQNPSNVYAVYSSFNRDPGDAHLYRSTDGGASWTASDGNLPDAPYYTLAVNPDNPQMLWIAGDLGLFVSGDGGATWAMEDPSFPVVPTNDLKIMRDPQGLALYAFTHGRGAWRARISGNTAPPK